MANRAKQVETTVPPTKGVPQKPEPVQQTHASGPGPVLQPHSARVQRRLSGPADILSLHQTIGNQAVMRLLDKQRPAVQAKLAESSEEESVQRLGEGQREPSNAEIHSAAARGISTPATTLPFSDRIQASFGRHSIGHIKAHVGSEAARAAQDMSAVAYASGNHVVFGGTPDLHTAAHEAAHIVQQQAGLQLFGGIGREGDAYERHADEVASVVVAGRAAEELLEPFVAGPKAEGPGEPSVVHHNHEPIRMRPANNALQQGAVMLVQRMVIAAAPVGKIDKIIAADIAFQHARAGGQVLTLADLEQNRDACISNGEWIIICGHGEAGKIEGKDAETWSRQIVKIKGHEGAGGVFLSACLSASPKGSGFNKELSDKLQIQADIIGAQGLKINDFSGVSGSEQVAVNDSKFFQAADKQGKWWKEAIKMDQTLGGISEPLNLSNISQVLEKGQALLNNTAFKEFFKSFVDDLKAADLLITQDPFVKQSGESANLSLAGSPTFTVKGFKTTPGQQLYIVGSVPELGNWDPTKAVKLNYVNENEWSGKVFFTQSLERDIEYKYIMRQGDTIVWETRGNRAYKVPKGFKQVTDTWST